MSNISVKIEGGKEVAAAFRRSPFAMRLALRKNLLRGGHEIAREAQRNLRKNKSMAFSTLIQSLIVRAVSDFETHVTVGAAHGVYVEEGSAPGGQPNRQTLLDWIRVKRIQPLQGQTLDDLEFLIGRKIRQKGIKAKPFFEPAVEAKRSRVMALIELGVEEGLQSAGLA